MSPSSKRQTTMAKLARERGVKEKRALKQEKREARKRAAEEERAAAAGGDTERTEEAAGDEAVSSADAPQPDGS